MNVLSRRTSKCILGLVAAALFGAAVWWVQTIPPQPDMNTDIVHPNGQAFAGSAACQSCHAHIVQSHQQTAHFRTSQKASVATVAGSFLVGKNSVSFGPNAYVAAERRIDGLYQVGYVDGQAIMAQRFDIVVGSGRKGQTYLFWHKDRLFQLPLSYFAPTHEWTNSPGYPADQILFNRPISGRCLECHGTYAKQTRLGQPDEGYEQNQLILGVDCERCHGPASRHVAYHTAHPTEQKARYIVNAAMLSRQQRLDACALCHSGLRNARKPAFSFVTGDRLTDFSTPDYNLDSLANLDVHGNQYGLLMASRCFQKSPSMDCQTCHSAHTVERTNLTLFSRRCLTCHQTAHATGRKALSKAGMSQNCIDCHMPVTASRQLTLRLTPGANSTPNVVRTHRIGIYKQASQDVTAYLHKLSINLSN